MPLEHTPLYEECIRTLQAEQLPNGSFRSYSWKEINSPSETRTTFYTSLTILALKDCKDPRVKKLVAMAASFLKEHQYEDGSYNYIQKGAATSFPNDFDDTCVALAALYHTNPDLRYEHAIVITKLLMRNESSVGGPYYTWIVPSAMRAEWSDIDIGVNSNIGYLLSLYDIHNPILDEYIAQKVREKDFNSLYYHRYIILLYFISAWYKGDMLSEICHEIAEILQSPKDALEAALGIVAYLQSGGDRKDCEYAISFLLTSQITLSPVYIESKAKDQCIYSGSKAFLAAVLLQVLTLYTHEPLGIDDELVRFSERAVQIAKARFEYFDTEIRDRAWNLIDAVISHDKDLELIRTPYIFSGTYSKKTTLLAAANILGWIGYTIYDDILDNEGSLVDIPLANICIREVSLIFERSLSDPRKYTSVAAILDGIEEANMWEYTTCRMEVRDSIATIPDALPSFGNLERLAQKSLGLALAPIALSRNSEDTQHEAIQEFYTHYLIARQLHDDAHDWYTDLRAGKINYVSTLLLQSFGKRIDLDKDKQQLQNVFWNSVIDTISPLILSHTQKAKEFLLVLQLPDKSYLLQKLEQLEQGARRAIDERNAIKKLGSNFA